MRIEGNDPYHYDLNREMVPLFEFVVKNGIKKIWPQSMLENWSIVAINGKMNTPLAGGHMFSGWQHYLYKQFSIKGKESIISIDDYINFRHKLRKKGFEAPGLDTCTHIFDILKNK